MFQLSAHQELIDLCPPRPLAPRALPRLVRLEPWQGTERNGKPLVSCRRPMDFEHITAESAKSLIKVVNIQEGNALEMDPWMLQQQRQAWEADLPVFPVSREPSAPYEGREQIIKRARVEEVLRQGEEISGLPFCLSTMQIFVVAFTRPAVLAAIKALTTRKR